MELVNSLTLQKAAIEAQIRLTDNTRDLIELRTTLMFLDGAIGEANRQLGVVQLFRQPVGLA